MAVTGKTKRECASEIKKKKIFNTAFDMFREYGFENTTISDISRATGMSTGSIYNFFGSKEGIITAAIDQFGTFTISSKNWDWKVKHPGEGIRELIYQYADVLESYGTELARHMVDAVSQRYNNKDGSFADTETLENLKKFMADCIEARTINRKRTPEEGAQLILEVLENTCLRWVSFGYSLHEKLDGMFGIIMLDMVRDETE